MELYWETCTPPWSLSTPKTLRNALSEPEEKQHKQEAWRSHTALLHHRGPLSTRLAPLLYLADTWESGEAPYYGMVMWANEGKTLLLGALICIRSQAHPTINLAGPTAILETNLLVCEGLSRLS